MSLSTHLADPRSTVRGAVHSASQLVLESMERGEVGRAANDALGLTGLAATPLIVPRPTEVLATLSGVAFDYLARINIGSIDPYSTVAWRGVQMLHVDSPAELTQQTLYMRIHAQQAWGIVSEKLNNRRVRPERRAAFAFVLAHFESIERAGLQVLDGALGQALLAVDSGEDFIKSIPRDAIDDASSMLEVSTPVISEWRTAIRGGGWYASNPAFAGNGAVGGADADWIVDGTLVELKTQSTLLTAGTVREALFQALGYALLDWDDEYELCALCAWFPRYGRRWTWRFEDLLGPNWEEELVHHRGIMRLACTLDHLR